MPNQQTNNSGPSTQLNFVDSKHEDYFKQAQSSALPQGTRYVRTTPQSGTNPFNYGLVQNQVQAFFPPTNPEQVPPPQTLTLQNNILSPQPNPLDHPSQSPLVEATQFTKPIQQPVLQKQNQAPTTVQISRMDPPSTQYINPSNFKPLERPKSIEDLKKQALEANKTLPGNFYIHQDEYKKLEPKDTKLEINTHEILKLCIYVIPVFPIFILLLRFSNDEEILWHTRQSTLTQTLWFVVLYFLNSTGAPLIAGGGLTVATLWNLICIGFLIYAGSMAYMGKKYRIPIISEIGTNFIDKKG